MSLAADRGVKAYNPDLGGPQNKGLWASSEKKFVLPVEFYLTAPAECGSLLFVASRIARLHLSDRVFSDSHRTGDGCVISSLLVATVLSRC